MKHHIIKLQHSRSYKINKQKQNIYLYIFKKNKKHQQIKDKQLYNET